MTETHLRVKTMANGNSVGLTCEAKSSWKQLLATNFERVELQTNGTTWGYYKATINFTSQIYDKLALPPYETKVTVSLKIVFALPFKTAFAWLERWFQPLYYNCCKLIGSGFGFEYGFGKFGTYDWTLAITIGPTQREYRTVLQP